MNLIWRLREEKKLSSIKNVFSFSFIHKFICPDLALAFLNFFLSLLLFSSLSLVFLVRKNNFFRAVFHFFISEAFTTRNQYCAFKFEELHFFPVHILFSRWGQWSSWPRLSETQSSTLLSVNTSQEF